MTCIFIVLVFLGLSSTVFCQFYLKSTSGNLDCNPSLITCLSNTTFTTCTNQNNLTILTNVVIECPEGYVCYDATTKPCVLPNQIPTTTTEGTTKSITTESIIEITTENATESTTVSTTVETTTRHTVARPSSKPHCTSSNVGVTYAGENCNQYYICVKHSILFIIKYYKATLYTCDNDMVFSITLMKCVSDDQSDCP